MDFDVEERTILKVRHGSYAYGTNIEGSDIDIKGICIPPIEYYMGYLKNFEQEEKKDPEDSVIYSLRKFIKLAADNNPNIIEVLFVDQSDILKCDTFGEKILEIKDNFLSKRAGKSFSGFAYSQLKRIKTHRGWLLNPPKRKPEREDFGLSNVRAITKSELGALHELQARDSDSVDKNTLDILLKEKQYARAMQNWASYNNWLKNRNPKRAATEAKFGYDTKHAAHLIRLLRMCCEILTSKKVIVKRPDAEELISIRLGCWDYDRLMEETHKINTQIEYLYKTSDALPYNPKVKAIDSYITTLTYKYLRMKDVNNLSDLSFDGKI